MQTKIGSIVKIDPINMTKVMLTCFKHLLFKSILKCA